MRAEAEWTMSGHLPSLEEYMEVTLPSFGLGPIALKPLYLIGPELTEEVVRSLEYHEMFRHVATCTRHLNDLQTYDREEEQGKTNSVLLLARCHGSTMEAAKAEYHNGVREGAAEDRGQGRRCSAPASASGVLEHLQDCPPAVQGQRRLLVDQGNDPRGERGCARAAVLGRGGKIDSQAAAASIYVVMFFAAHVIYF